MDRYCLMCDDQEAARRNRQRVESQDCMRFYEQQAHAVAQWQLGEPKPESVVVGELPCVGKEGKRRIKQTFDIC